VRYELYYWPSIQGRGEFVRLSLEEGAADYADVARMPERAGFGVPAMMRFLQADDVERPPFAPPFLKAGDLLIAHTANILLYLGPRLGLVPADEANRFWIHQLQLSISDWVLEVHDTHHPIGSALYYEEQKPEALRRAQDFLARRLPKFLAYFERVLERKRDGGPYLTGNDATYADLSLFQMIAGLRFAFPRAMTRLEPSYARVIALHDCVAQRPRIAAYLASARRIPFNENGIFRRYPELDG
jgi:glutathione S-transferase